MQNQRGIHIYAASHNTSIKLKILDPKSISNRVLQTTNVGQLMFEKQNHPTILQTESVSQK